MPTDLADVGALARNLAAAGFDSARPALFTCEGIFCYLPQASPPNPKPHTHAVHLRGHLLLPAAGEPPKH